MIDRNYSHSYISYITKQITMTMMRIILYYILLLLIIGTSATALLPTTSVATTATTAAFYNTINKARKLMKLPMVLDKSNLSNILDDGPINVKNRKFLINGWRWHTASVIYDLRRFRSLLSLILDDNLVEDTAAYVDKVIGCNNFVCGFNLKALLRVETELFFPWLIELLPTTLTNVMKDITEEHKTIKKNTLQIQQSCNKLSSVNGTSNIVIEIKTIDLLLKEMVDCALRIQKVQEDVFVPYISAYVSKDDQEKFNRRVITRLGLLDSQVSHTSIILIIIELSILLPILNHNTISQNSGG